MGETTAQQFIQHFQRLFSKHFPRLLSTKCVCRTGVSALGIKFLASLLFVISQKTAFMDFHLYMCNTELYSQLKTFVTHDALAAS